VPISLPAALEDGIRDRFQSSPLTWAIYLPLFQDAATNIAARLTAYPHALSIGGKTYSPWPMSLSKIEADRDGSPPQMRVLLSNVGRFLMPYLEQPADSRGLLGRRVQIHLVNLGDDPSAAHDEQFILEFEASGCNASRASAELTLDVLNFFDRDMPQDRFNPRTCRHNFGQGACTYRLSPWSTFSTCTNLYDACVARSVDMLGRGLDAMLQQFGGFPGVLPQ
jgi:phage-related protein